MNSGHKYNTIEKGQKGANAATSKFWPNVGHNRWHGLVGSGGKAGRAPMDAMRERESGNVGADQQEQGRMVGAHSRRNRLGFVSPFLLASLLQFVYMDSKAAKDCADTLMKILEVNARKNSALALSALRRTFLYLDTSALFFARRLSVACLLICSPLCIYLSNLQNPLPF